MEEKIEALDQYDYIDDSYLEKVQDKYAFGIGSFLIEFSRFEDALNTAIANYIHDGGHQFGYVIVERLLTANKIELLYRLYLGLLHHTNQGKIAKLKGIKISMVRMNEFRNIIAHANWQSLSKDKYVRSKIFTDNNDGMVKFRNTKITLKILRQKTSELIRLASSIEIFCDDAFQG